MCTEEFIRMMFTVDLYGNRGLDSRRLRVFIHFISYPNLIALIPPDITSFVGWNERNKVGVRDGGGSEKKKRSTEIHE